METVKPSKSNCDEISKLNFGHTSEEWGITKETKSKQNMVINSEDFWNCEE